MTTKRTGQKAATTPREASQRLRQASIKVTEPQRGPAPKPVAVPGLQRALREVRGDR